MSLLGILGPIGMTELIVILIIVLLLFGGRLPNMMRNLGRGVTEFKHGLKDKDEDDDTPVKGGGA